MAGAVCADEGASDVRATLGEPEAGLPSTPARSRQHSRDGEIPRRTEPPRETLRGMVAAREAAVAVGRHERECLDGRPRDGLRDDAGGDGAEMA